MSKLFKRQNNKEDYVLDRFKEELERNGLSINSVDAEGYYYIEVGGQNLKISLENTRKDFERDKDDNVILDLTDTILAYDINIPEKWEDAKDNIFLSFYISDFDFDEIINERVTNDFNKVYVYSDGKKFTWILKTDIETWSISTQELEQVANENAGSLLSKENLVFNDFDGHKLGRIDIERASLKGAVLFSSKLTDILKEKIGLPFYAVLPVRDFCYIFPECDLDYFSERLGSTVTDEFVNSGYPITTELLKFTENEVITVGKYPTDNQNEKKYGC